MKAVFRNLLLPIVFVVIGFVLGYIFRPRIIDHHIAHKNYDLRGTSIITDTVYDICTGRPISLMDTLSYRSRNLLVFWSPTCSYCKKFFLHQLNEQIVGIYCFPLMNDLEYLKFYVDKNNIKAAQLMALKSETFVPVEAPSIAATPTFVIVDNKGKRLAQYVGINEIDEMISFLYQGIR